MERKIESDRRESDRRERCMEMKREMRERGTRAQRNTGRDGEYEADINTERDANSMGR